MPQLAENNDSEKLQLPKTKNSNLMSMLFVKSIRDHLAQSWVVHQILKRKVEAVKDQVCRLNTTCKVVLHFYN